MKIVENKELNNLLITKFKKNRFKRIQLKIIKSILSKKDTLVVLPTGFGKSLCFQLPSLCLNGTTIVISPLISLMQDQVKQLRKLNIKASYINSSLSPYEAEVRLSKLLHNYYKLIYVSPERLNNKDFLDICLNIKIPLLVVDEAHCISSWGQNFRPDYKKISVFIDKLKTKPILAAFTATANKQVVNDIKDSLVMKKIKLFYRSPIRKNLRLNILHSRHKDKQFLQLLAILKKHKNKSGIIFALTRITTENLYKKLLFFNFDSYFDNIYIYHGGQDTSVRDKAQKKFLKAGNNLMIATNAFGMGIDKKNIRFVIHYQCPSSLESYCQEIGRAGRDLKIAHCYLLFNPNDLNIHKHFILSTSKKRFFRPDPIFLNKVGKLRSVTDLCLYKKCIKDEIQKYFLLTNRKRGNRSCNVCSHCRGGKNLIIKKNSNKFRKYQQNVPSISYDYMNLLQPKNDGDFLKTPGVGDGIIDNLLAFSPQT